MAGTEAEHERAGLAWQVSVWDGISQTYLREVERRFAPVVEGVIARAALAPGQQVLDHGTGTGAVAVRAAPLVRPGGAVLAVDISSEMLALARQQAQASGLDNVSFREGRAEAIPAEDGAFDVLLASLCLMFVVDRAAAAREIGRVLRPGGRFVAAVWAGPERCDFVRFLQTAGRFAPAPPAPGVGPGALADPSPFLAQLADAGIETRVEVETLGFDFPNFASAWDTLAGVTTAGLPPGVRAEAQAAVQAAMWPEPDRPRYFRNVTQFIVGRRRDVGC